MTEVITKLVVDCSTGIAREVELTEEELSQREVDRKAFEKAEKARKAAEAEQVALEASANAKLEALGLTPEEIAALKG
jgi:multidrug efflux pump subunit AcrA (membrane-fusion protein)